MRRSEALAALELHETATQAEIKMAYRDLVKVWHPDRFGAETRLRQRAQERLQQINEAFRCLDSGDLEPEAFVPPEFVANGPSRERSEAQEDRDTVLRGWVYLAIFLVVGAFAGYVLVQHLRATREAADLAAEAATSQPATAAPSTSKKGPVRPTAIARRDEMLTRVTPLTEAQTRQIDAACDAFAPGSQGRGDCARRQVAAMTGNVDLSGLTSDERTSVEHVCARAASYAKCAADQIAGLAAVQLHPDLSRLSARDRSAVERACSSSRDHDGPAAYDRCIAEFEKMLLEHER